MTRRIAPLLVAAGAVAAFLPALGNGFVNWDDLQNFLENPHYRGLGWTQLRWMFTSAHMGHYIPLTWITLGADYALWGMRPLGYHLTNLLLHAGAAVACYAVSLRLLRLAVPASAAAGDLRLGATVAALLFAVHPLRVESVAWVTERRDVLSGLLYLCAILAYLRWVERGPERGRGWYRAALALFVAGTLAKSIVVTLPFALLVLDVYPLRRLGGTRGWRRPGVWLDKLPFLLLGAAVGAVAFLGVLSGATLRPMGEMGVPERLVLSAYGIAFYLWKSLVPVGLSPLYQLPITVTYFHLAAAAGGTILAVALRRRAPAFSAAWAIYLATLAPVLGIFQNGPQVVADRYSYLACLPWAVLIGGLAARPWRGRAVLRVLLAAWILALGALTWEQSQVWHSSVTLWSHAIAVNPSGRAGHGNLARAWTIEGHLAAAIAEWEETSRLSMSPAPFQPLIGQLYDRAGIPRPAPTGRTPR